MLLLGVTDLENDIFSVAELNHHVSGLPVDVPSLHSNVGYESSVTAGLVRVGQSAVFMWP